MAAAITPAGVCGQLLQAVIDGRWHPVISPQLVNELEDVLSRAKFRRWLTQQEADRFVTDLRVLADEIDDPPAMAIRQTADPDDEFLLALAAAARVEALISGDPHLLNPEGLEPPVVTPAAFLGRLQR